jgi:arylsulfatase A-like enzyme
MDRPNLLWIMCDQLRYHALGCHGDPNLAGKTPHLDRLAGQGVDFTHAYSHYPVCTPFRGALVTGQYNHVNDVRVHGDMLPTDARCMGHMFRDAGYDTAWVGKWHLASTISPAGWSAGADYWVPPKVRGGFERWHAFDCSNHAYDTRYADSATPFPPKQLEGYQTDALTDLSLRVLEQQAGGGSGGWAHVLSVEAPHPMRGADGRMGFPAPAAYEAMFDPADIVLRDNVPDDKADDARRMLAGYYAMIANLDHNVGRVLGWLDERGLSDDTIVCFFSDHGEMGLSHGRTNKQVPWDESIRVPLIVRPPAGSTARPGVTSDTLVSVGLDLLPTCLSVCGVPIEPQMQGVDQSRHVLDTEPGDGVRDAVLIQWLGAATYGFGEGQYRAIRTWDHLYSVAEQPELRLFYNCRADPHQQRNLFDDPASMVLRQRMHQALEREVLQSGEAVPGFVRDQRPGPTG